MRYIRRKFNKKWLSNSWFPARTGDFWHRSVSKLCAVAYADNQGNFKHTFLSQFFKMQIPVVQCVIYLEVWCRKNAPIFNFRLLNELHFWCFEYIRDRLVLFRECQFSVVWLDFLRKYPRILKLNLSSNAAAIKHWVEGRSVCLCQVNSLQVNIFMGHFGAITPVLEQLLYWPSYGIFVNIDAGFTRTYYIWFIIRLSGYGAIIQRIITALWPCEVVFPFCARDSSWVFIHKISPLRLYSMNCYINFKNIDPLSLNLHFETFRKKKTRTVQTKLLSPWIRVFSYLVFPKSSPFLWSTAISRFGYWDELAKKSFGNLRNQYE